MSDERPRRRPQVIAIDDPDLVVPPEPTASVSRGRADRAPPSRSDADDRGERAEAQQGAGGGVGAILGRKWSWGATFIATLGLLFSLALALSIARFVAIAFERQDWIGWLAVGLAALAALSLIVIVGGEVAGLLRLRRLGRVRRDLEKALDQGDAAGERRAVEAILAGLADRPELKWQISTLNEHAASASDPGDLARLADRDVIAPLDGEARRLVAASARRVSVVTALSPAAVVTIGWMLAEVMRLLRGLATLYGGRPGFFGTARLARSVITHLLAAGGLALTEDLLGQLLGQDIMRRLSRRLGESVFNAALTARIGAAAIDVIRPLPFIEAPRVRARDLVVDVVRGVRTQAQTEAERPRSG